MQPSISIVIPTLNEGENILPLLARISAVDEIIFVDDGSTDETVAIARSAGIDRVRVIERDDAASGLAGAVIAGARAATGEIIVVMDADLSHPPESIGELVRPLVDDAADMVIGSRYVAGGTTPGWPVWRRTMSRLAAALAYPLTRVHDSMCGFFAIRRSLLLALNPRTNGFKIAFETIVHAGSNFRVLEVPIVFRDRERGVSKMSFRVAIIFFFHWLGAIARSGLRHRTAVSRMPQPALCVETASERRFNA